MNSPITLFRIGVETSLRKADDLSGNAAASDELGFRWNLYGVRMVYASTSRALACLETLVHLDPGGALPLNRFLVEISIPYVLWDRRTIFDPTTVAGWDKFPPGETSQNWGSSWALSNGALVAEVPSVIVPEEKNVLINPVHPEADSLAAAKVRPWTYDARLT